ncbi:thiamine pyrophosphate-binding protein [Vibrio phage Va2]|nr:thiamine pyrophosphate-binding protein [Vibrio phage Va2]
MLNTEKFVEGLVEAGYSAIFCVPCSFATELINAVLEDERIDYFPSACEFSAVSQCAGYNLAGQKGLVIMQSTGVGNSFSTLTSLLQPYGINIPIISSKRTWKEGDPEIQHGVLAENLEKTIFTAKFGYQVLDQFSEEEAISQLDDSYNQPVITILNKGTFSKYEQKIPTPEDDYIPRIEFLKALNEKYAGRDDIVFCGTTGATSREMYTYMKDCNNFLQAGNMGGILAVATGAALANPDKTYIVLDGDSASMMHMGSSVNASNWLASNSIPVNMLHALFDNNLNATTGGQPSPMEGFNMEAYMMEHYPIALSGILNPEDLVDAIEEMLEDQDTGLRGCVIKCSHTSELPPRPVVQDLIDSKLAFIK